MFLAERVAVFAQLDCGGTAAGDPKEAEEKKNAHGVQLLAK